MKKKIIIDSDQVNRLAMLVNSRNDSSDSDWNLNAQEEDLSRKITEMLEKKQDFMNRKDRDDHGKDDKNIHANWQAIKDRIERLEKSAETADKPDENAGVHSLAQARTRNRARLENKQARNKLSKYIPFSLVTIVAAVAAVLLYVMPGNQQATDEDNFGVKGTDGNGVAVCTFELRSAEHTYVLGDQAALVSGGEQFALVARCPEPQILHAILSTQGEESVLFKNSSISNSSSQILFPVAGEGGLMQFAVNRSYRINIVSSSSVLDDQDQVFANPELKSNWHLSYVVTAE